MSKSSFEINHYEFDHTVFNRLQNVHQAKDLWPVVYILSDGAIKEAYVGESTDTLARLGAHLSSPTKKQLTSVHLITSEKFNKSATLDIEANLIKYISGDGHYKLRNANLGISNHNYYQKSIYWQLFESIWEKLIAEGISKHTLSSISNSDLYKYSPYKSLSKDQRQSLLSIIRNFLNDTYTSFLIEGGAGTGKTLLAIFLFKLLNTDNEDFNFHEFDDDEKEFIEVISEFKRRNPEPKMALVVPMSSLRQTLKKVFRNIKGLRSSMVIGPTDLAKERYDIVVVDEAHRLRRRVNLTNYAAFDIASEKLGMNKSRNNELDWVIAQSDKRVLFYDQDQSIKPTDIPKAAFDELRTKQSIKTELLKTQFRVLGGQDYVNFVKSLLYCRLGPKSRLFSHKEYQVLLFDSVGDIASEIKKREAEHGLSRLVAGFAWQWNSKNNDEAVDISIDGVELKWNAVDKEWINSENAINEVGCIHTVQGYDLNYAGIIFGNEIGYDTTRNEVVIRPEFYHDRNGKVSITDPNELKKFIINIYQTMMLRGIKGTYLHACDKNLQEYLSQFIPNYKTTTKIKILSKDNVIPFENSIPLYDLQAAAGDFSELQYLNQTEWIELPPRYKVSKDLFACKVVGESMNKVIPNGSICLFRKDQGGSRNGRIVLVEHTDIQDPDTGLRLTVKEYRSKKSSTDNQWEHESIVLKALSNDPTIPDIILSPDESQRLKVIGIFECLL